ncbi:MAG: 4-(cytidine 5'-diphospho)-2-C-methyl-D-erythritol kinase [Candidatus Delongbacteria bacterium]|nr:4-(cytidine 5'-diphospho)-2-C-methyl-D-erythritol kinase [Candidatus Delongbacteria bacterium]
MPDTIRLDCPAKINLGLKIVGTRPDGYHNLITVFQAITLSDRLTVSLARHDPTRFHCEGMPELVFDERNTLYKTWMLLRSRFHLPDRIAIHLEKHIPAGGGLGGGSSDAAGLIQAVDHLFGLSLSLDEKIEIARQVGMDVPFFLAGPTAIGIERGDILFPARLHNFDYRLLLLFPPFPVSTAEIYRAYKFPLTKSDFFIKIEALLSNGNAGNPIRIDEFIPILENDLEQAAFPLYPQLRQWRNYCLENGAVCSLMSGSGSTLFALFRDHAFEPEKLRRTLSPDGIRLLICEPLTAQHDEPWSTPY